jgi:CTP synthase
VDCVIIPGGFGSRGTEGKIKIATYCREHKVPLLGICLGMQVMTVEFGKKLQLCGATSSEWKEECLTDSKVGPMIHILPDQTGIMGGTMRLGNYETELDPKSKVCEYYCNSKGKQNIVERHIVERHRHRYEVNNRFIECLEHNGFMFSGRSKDGKLMEIVELDDRHKHPFYVGCQFHPEFSSSYRVPHPLFINLLKSC